VEISTVGVVGAGYMGGGIAQVCVQNGIEVLLFGDTDESLSRAEDQVLRGLHRAEQPAAFSLLRKSTNLSRMEGCDLVIECASYDLEAKRALLRRLDAHLPPTKILAVESASLPIETVSASVENPDRLFGLHFFKPVPVMKAVELIRPTHAAEKFVAPLTNWLQKIGKSPARCKDAPGFIVNRVARPLLLESARLLEAGRGTPVAVDRALVELAGFPMGPFQILDFAGLQEEFIISETIYKMLGSPERLKPSGLEEKMIARGCRGRSNSRGYYVYGDNPPGTMNPLLSELVEGYAARPMAPADIVETVLVAIFREAQELLNEGVANEDDIDEALRLSLAWPKGPFAWRKERER
jgi:3-hydroxybutyryl-CoA dehydrogenase